MQGIEYFVQMHLDGAGVKDCDHWHDDAGKRATPTTHQPAASASFLRSHCDL